MVPRHAGRPTGPIRRITGHESTGATKAPVTEWVHERLLGADRDALDELARDPRYVEHGDRVPAGCCDLWRVADGRIVEHWEVCQPAPERLPHGNGFF